MLEEPPTNDRIHVEVVSTSRMCLLYPKVSYGNCVYPYIPASTDMLLVLTMSILLAIQTEPPSCSHILFSVPGSSGLRGYKPFRRCY